MVNIDVKRFECVQCGTIFTAPQSINRIANEFSEPIFVDVSFDKTLFLTKASKKAKAVDEAKKKFANNTFTSATLESVQDELTDVLCKARCKLIPIMKEAEATFNSTVITDATEIILKCPVCDTEAYRWKK